MGPLNEAIDAVVEMSSPSVGLLGINFINFPANAKFDAHLLKRLAKRSFGLNELGFGEMVCVNDAARAQLLTALQGAIKANGGSLTRVDLIEFTPKPDEGLAFLNALANNASRVEFLDLGGNKELFKAAEFTNAVCLLLSKQTTLKHLLLGGNDLSSKATEQLMATLKIAKISATIETLVLGNGNWDEDLACEALAHLLATAPALKTVYILDQVGSKPIEVTVTAAAVDVKRKETDDDVCSVTRTNSQEILVE